MSFIKFAIVSIVLLGCNGDGMKLDDSFSPTSKQAIQEAMDEWCTQTAGGACAHADANSNFVIRKVTYGELASESRDSSSVVVGVCCKNGIELVTIDELEADRALALHELGHHFVQNWAMTKCQKHPEPRLLENGTTLTGVMVSGNKTSMHLTQLDLEWYCHNKGCRVEEGLVVW